MSTLRAIWATPDERCSGVAHLWTGKGKHALWRSLCGQERFYSVLRTNFVGFPECASCANIDRQSGVGIPK